MKKIIHYSLIISLGLILSLFINFKVSDKIEVHAAGYTITFDSNGGTSVPSISDVSELPSPLPTTTRSDYTFLGWYYDPLFTNKAYSLDIISFDVILYANWQSNAYTITFETNSGNTIPLLYGNITNGQTTIPSLPIPERDTDIFTGWFYDIELTNRVLPNQIINNDITIYARWITIDKISNLEDKANDIGGIDGYNTGLIDGENRGYTYGYDDGYYIGYQKGKIDAADEGIEILEENAYNTGYNDGRDVYAYKRDDKYLNYNQAYQLGAGESDKLKEIVTPLIIFMLISTVIFSAIKILGGRKE